MNLINRRGEKAELDLGSAASPTTQDVIDRLKPCLEKAARERTGASFFLTDAEKAVFSIEDLYALLEETGYQDMCRSVQQIPPIPVGYRLLDSTGDVRCGDLMSYRPCPESPLVWTVITDVGGQFQNSRSDFVARRVTE